MNELILTAAEEESGTRLDAFLAHKESALSRNYIQKIIKEGSVRVNDIIVTKAGHRISAGDTVKASIPEPEAYEASPEEIPLDILYEDDDILIVNKPKGMVVHPAPGHLSGTLVNAVMHHCRDSLSGINGTLRPGIVHRIDKDTTGSLIICKNDEAHSFIAAQLQKHTIKRLYRAIVTGHFKEHSFTIDKPIGRNPRDRKKMAVTYKNSRNAVTEVRVIKELKGHSYVECELKTGRTHQIRAHMADTGHPVLGDAVYGPSKQKTAGLEGQTLHAYLIGFEHPRTHEYMEFIAPIPAYFEELLTRLES